MAEVSILNAYKSENNECRRLIHCHELSKEKKIIGDGNIASFYNFINRQLSCKESAGALKDENNIILTDNSDKAELLNCLVQCVQ